MPLVWDGGKEPGENVIDFDIDWTLRLAGDTIISSAWAFVTTDSALTIASNSFTSTFTKVWLSGGTAGYIYELRNTVTTTDGDTLIENAQLLVAAR